MEVLRSNLRHLETLYSVIFETEYSMNILDSLIVVVDLMPTKRNKTICRKLGSMDLTETCIYYQNVHTVTGKRKFMPPVIL